MIVIELDGYYCYQNVAELTMMIMSNDYDVTATRLG